MEGEGGSGRGGLSEAKGQGGRTREDKKCKSRVTHTRPTGDPSEMTGGDWRRLRQCSMG